jgi:hypothetical protein
MGLKRTHTLYLQSKHRTNGSSSQYTITLPDVIQSSPNLEKFKISLLQFSTYNDFLQIREGSNTVTVNNSDITLPHGTYTFQKLAKVLELYIGCTVKWLQELNAIEMTFVNSTTVAFDNIGYVLGFESFTEYTGHVVTSVSPMRPFDTSHIIFKLNNICPIEEQLVFSNHNSTGEVRIDNILSKILINASPFQLVSHQQVLESDGLYTNDNSLNVLEIALEDTNGNEIDIGEHEFVLKIEALDYENYDAKTVIENLKDIKQNLKDILMYKVLRFKQ